MKAKLRLAKLELGGELYSDGECVKDGPKDPVSAKSVAKVCQSVRW